MAFDPKQFGATEVSTSTFDPSAFGATAAPNPQPPSNPQPAPPPGFLGTLKSAVEKGADFLANALIVSPLKSIGAAATGPGRNITSLMTAGADQPVANAAGNLAHVTTLLIK